MEEEDIIQMWRIMSRKDLVDRKKFWKLETEVLGRVIPPRARVGHLEVIVTKPRNLAGRPASQPAPNASGTSSQTRSR